MVVGCIKIVLNCVLTTILCPIYAFKCGFWMGDHNQFFLPMKSNCSSNGRNKGTFLSWPYILELISTVFCLLAWLNFNHFEHQPTYIIHRQDLLKTNVTFWRTEFAASGLYRDRTQKPGAMTTGFNWFSRNTLNSSLPEWAGYATDEQAASIATQLNTNMPCPGCSNITTAYDMITFSKACMCKGVMDSKKLKYHKTCAKLVKKGKAPKGVCIGTAQMKSSLDMSKLGASVTGKQRNAKFFALISFLINLFRFVSLIMCPRELRKPGSQIFGGLWGAVFAFLAMQQSNGILKALKKGGVQPYKMYNPASLKKMIIRPYLAADSWKCINAAKKFARLSIPFTFLQLFLSSEAYCTDCTVYAYTNRGLEDLKKARRSKTV